MAKKQTPSKTAKTGKTAKESQLDARDAMVRQLIQQLEQMLRQFIQGEDISESLSGTQRLRLFSAGVRNYGFIDKAFDIARDNPQFMPPNFELFLLDRNLRDLEDLRQLIFILQQFLQAANNAFMLHADSCYRDALRIYGSLREQSRNRVPGAQALFDALRTFFRRPRRSGDEPTEIELERDFKRLIHGKADGEIIIENESPHITEGIRKVIDHVHTGRSAFKETEEASIDEGKSTRKK